MGNLIEQLKIEAEKKAGIEKKAQEKLAEAQKSLEENPEDETLKKKVQGLTLAVNNAHAKAQAAADALQEVEKKAALEKDAADALKEADGNKIRVRFRSSTGRPAYYRAGLRFGSVDTDYEVSQDVFDILAQDSHLVGGKVE